MHGFELTDPAHGKGRGRASVCEGRSTLPMRIGSTTSCATRNATRPVWCSICASFDFVDSAGMSRILAARRRARRAGRHLVLVRGSKAVQRFLQIAALTEHFEFVADPHDAVPRSASAAAGPMPDAAPAAPSE